jgi:hypothetical protein
MFRPPPRRLTDEQIKAAWLRHQVAYHRNNIPALSYDHARDMAHADWEHFCGGQPERYFIASLRRGDGVVGDLAAFAPPLTYIRRGPTPAVPATSTAAGMVATATAAAPANSAPTSTAPTTTASIAEASTSCPPAATPLPDRTADDKEQEDEDENYDPKELEKQMLKATGEGDGEKEIEQGHEQQIEKAGSKDK